MQSVMYRNRVSWVVLAALLLAIVVACSAKVRPLQDLPQGKPLAVEVLVVPLQGALGMQELALCHRALRDAANNGMRVVFRLDDAGGAEESMSDIEALLDAVQASKATTLALVRGHARGGAAYLALLCDELSMLKGSDIGDVAPIETTTEAIRAMLEDGVARQRLLDMGVMMRERLKNRRGTTKLSANAVRLCEGMADRSLELLSVTLRENGKESTRIVAKSELQGLQAAATVILNQTALLQPLVLAASEAADYGIGQVVQSVDDFYAEVLRTDKSKIGELEFSWAETMVGWLEQMQSALLVLGCILLILEIKTPGIGIPGVLGVLLLSLSLFYSYLVGLAEIPELLLFFLGLAAVGVEIFVLPGTVLFGAVGFVCLVSSLVLSKQTFVLPATLAQEEILLQNLLQLMFLILLVMGLSALIWRLLPRIPWLKTIMLTAPRPVLVGAILAGTSSPLIGCRGTTSTVLRPAGILDLAGEPVDVVTRGDFVEAGVEVQIVEVIGNRVVVERTDPRRGERGSVGFVLLIAVIGLVLLLAEVALVSFGALSIASGLALIAAVFLAFQESQAFGITMLIGEAIAAPLVLTFAFRLLPKTSLGRAILLQPPKPDSVADAADPANAKLLHKTGVTISALRPSGFASIDGQRIDVVTRGEMLEEHCPIRVVDITGNRVVVVIDHASGKTVSSL
ncbi:MAG: hypothetical protein EXS02_15310 [Planctomycetes bacterium]|nr:hypothetical protein [Planctomycetota bacterium]